ncbi:Hypothetical predicted protein [Mytilus galloprovincialis]|uniref:Uncharacterized protein n=1 Tax=Mytilus galloprovincialis TaxID=29158 RepID=A0A8B6E0X7_MYTGA|nr:Hypothetical predicted protein [Mytilus galloprovincialis]
MVQLPSVFIQAGKIPCSESIVISLRRRMTKVLSMDKTTISWLYLSSTSEEQEDFGKELHLGAVGPTQSFDIELEGELEVKFVEKKRDAFKKKQLRERIRQLEEVQVLSGSILGSSYWINRDRTRS